MRNPRKLSALAVMMVLLLLLLTGCASAPKVPKTAAEAEIQSGITGKTVTDHRRSAGETGAGCVPREIPEARPGWPIRGMDTCIQSRSGMRTARMSRGLRWPVKFCL